MTETAATIVTNPVTPPTNPPVATPPTAGSEPWYNNVNNPELRGYVELKGWKTQEDALSAIQGLEKIVSADKAGKTLILPDANNPEEVAQFYTKLGRPTDAKGYELQAQEGDKTGFTDAMAEAMFAAGISKEQSQNLYSKYSEVVSQIQEKQAQEFVQHSQNEMLELRQEWGINSDKNIELSRRAATALGLSAEDANALEHSLGSKKMMQLLHRIGSGMGESNFANSNGNNAFGMSPEAARAKISELKSDKEWVNRYRGGGVKEREEISRLHRIGFNG